MPSVPFEATVLDAMVGHVAVLDRSGTIIHVNQAWRRFACDADGAGVGTNYLDVCRRSADEGADALEGLTAILDGSRARFDLEYSCPCEHQERWFLMTATPLAAGGAVVVHSSITRQKFAEQVTRGQNALLESVANGEPLPTVLERLVRFMESRLPGSRCSILLRDGDRLRFSTGPSLPAAYNEAIAVVPIGPAEGSCGRAAHRRQAVITADIETDPNWDHYRHLATPHGLRSCWSFPILLASRADEGVLGTFALYQSVVGTPAARAVELLEGAAHLAGVAIESDRSVRARRESEERFRLLVDGISDYAVFMTAPGGRVSVWNRGAERIYGYSSSEAIGSDPARFEQTGAPRPPIHHRDEDERWQVRKDGSTFWASVDVTDIRGDEGQARGTAHIVRDLTERVVLDERIRETEKMEAIGRLAGGIAHDLNNLLTVLIGNADLLTDAAGDSEVVVESCAEIRAACDRAAELTRELLVFGRRDVVDLSVVDLNELLTERLRLVRRVVGPMIDLRLEATAQARWVRIDPAQLDLALMTLAARARDAMPESGRLSLRTIDAEEHVELWVTDTAEPMAAETRAHVFEPFFNSRRSGSGLGLALVYAVMRHCGGAVTIEDLPEGGTAFRLRFPAVEEPPSVAKEAHGDVRARGQETVLLVEDEPPVRHLMKAALESQGYRVHEAHRADAAIALYSALQASLDLVVTDVMMPGMNGRELVDKLTERGLSAPVVFVTGYADDPELRARAAEGRCFVQRKPFTRMEFLHKVRVALDSVTPKV